MSRETQLQALRERIGALAAPDSARKTRSSRVFGPISLGEAVIDGTLPSQGLARGALHEVMPVSATDFAAACGFALGLLTRALAKRLGSVLWIVAAHEAVQHGLVYPPGLAAFGFDPGRLVHVTVPKTEDILWAMEEGLSSSGLAAAIAILPERDRFYDFSASRRLVLRAAPSGTVAILLRSQVSGGEATAAETRWSVAAAPSRAVEYRGQRMPGLGPLRWRVELTRCKRGQPRQWLVEWDHETLSFRLASAVADRAPSFVAYDIQKRWAAVS